MTRSVAVVGLVSAITSAALVAGCASLARRDPGAVRIEAAKGHLSRGEWRTAFDILEQDLSDDEKARERSLELIRQFPQFVPSVLADSQVRVGRVASADEATSFKRNIESLARARLVSPADTDALMSALMKAVGEKNRNGEIPFLLSDDITMFPSLREEVATTIIFERSLGALKGQKPPSHLLVGKVFEYVNTKGQNSAEHRRLEASLPHIDFSKTQLESIVRPLYRSFAEERLAAMILTVHFKTDPPRRLLEEDLKSALRARSDLLRIVRDPERGALTVVVRELQLEERQFPERVQTVIVPYDQHDLLVGVLLLPRNASTHFEVAQGGAEINFAYEVIVEREGKVIAERLIRDSVRQEYRFCSNMRVVNVFGGTTAASAFPNQQVAALCQQGQQPVSVTTLRADILRRMTEEIAGIAPIMEAIRRSR